MNCLRRGQRFSVAELCGFLVLCMAVPFWFVQPIYSVLPLGLFLLACLSAPFLPRVPFFLPLISRGPAGSQGIALTFDDGPCPASTPLLLELLEKYHLSATFFVIGKKAETYPELIQAILDHGHSIGNHSYNHDNLLMLRSCTALKQDISTAQQVLNTLGVLPLLFRPPVGITNSRLKLVLEQLDLKAITFSCRVFDRGNRNTRNLAARVRHRLKPGDILLLHDNPPPTRTQAKSWRYELDTLFADLQRAYQIVPLETLIQRPVMGPPLAAKNGISPQ